jgi:uncharacterized membrane protein (TIGR02234 family)
VPDRPADRRRTFVPVVGAGVAAGLLAAVAGARPWFTGEDAGSSHTPLLPDVEQAGEMPLAAAVSLVVLAGWGVVLVTRGRVRRAAAGLAFLGAVGLVATVVAGWVTLPDQVSEAVRSSVATDTSGSQPTGWFWAAAVSAVVLVAAGALAVAWCPAWPEMGSRYDAPGAAGRPAEDVPPGERTNLDLWKQLDEGRDPTA